MENTFIRPKYAIKKFVFPKLKPVYRIRILQVSINLLNVTTDVHSELSTINQITDLYLTSTVYTNSLMAASFLLF